MRFRTAQAAPPTNRCLTARQEGARVSLHTKALNAVAREVCRSRNVTYVPAEEADAAAENDQRTGTSTARGARADSEDGRCQRKGYHSEVQCDRVRH